MSDEDPTYNVYSLVAGAVDKEEPFDDIDQAREHYEKLLAEVRADMKGSPEPWSVHLYDTVLGNMIDQKTSEDPD